MLCNSTSSRVCISKGQHCPYACIVVSNLKVPCTQCIKACHPAHAGVLKLKLKRGRELGGERVLMLVGEPHVQQASMPQTCMPTFMM